MNLDRASRAMTLACGAALAAASLTASAATLANRYSFTTGADDSVGGKHGALVNGPVVSSGNLWLDGAARQYVNLPNNLITGRTAITIEAWITPAANGNWTRIWDFGNSNAGEDRSDYGVKHFMCYLLPNLEATIYAGGQDSWVRSSPAFTLPVDQEAHVVWTSDGPTRKARLYVNGALVGKSNSAVNTPAVLGPTFNNWLGRSQFSADPYYSGGFNEFRIWNGALDPLQVAASLAAGADQVSTDPGTITGLTLGVTYQMIKGNTQQATVLASASNLPQPVNIADIDGIVYRSGNTNILTVTTNGLVRAVAAGSTSLTVSYGGQSTSETITVTEQPALLTHRYSFATDARDSVGQAHGSLLGGAGVAGGQLVLEAPSESYLALPAGVITNYSALTVEAWASFGAQGTWSRLWSFGDQNDAGLGRYYVELCPHGGAGDTYISISDADPGGNHADAVAVSGALDNRTNVHLVAVFSPLAGYDALYLDGRLAAVNTAPTVSVGGVRDIFNWIGRSLYALDPFLEGSVDEFRIYRGALSSLEVGVSHAYGPDMVKQAAGALQAIQLQLAPTMHAESGQAPTVLATYASLTNYSLTANSIGGVSGLSYASSDTNVLFLDADGLVRSAGLGTATLTATYQGRTSSVSIAVTAPPTAALRHRYSFSTDAADSVGSAHGLLQGAAAVRAGKLVLDGSEGAYVELPGGLVSGLASVTLEFWADFGPQPNWPRVFDFGSTVGTGGADFLFFTPKTHFGAHRFAIATGAGFSDLDGPGAMENGSVHVVCVYDPTTGFQGVYTNGVLEQAKYNARIPLSTVSSDFSYLGRSLFSADGYLRASLDELRIYEGRLTSAQVAASYRAGPDRMPGPVLRVSLSGNQAIFTWPADAAGFTLQSSPILGPGANWTAVGTPALVGDHYEVALPLSGAAFFRLRR